MNQRDADDIIRRAATDPNVQRARIERAAPRDAIVLFANEVAARRPGGWNLDMEGVDGQRFFHGTFGWTVIWSVAAEKDGRLWIHASLATHRPRLPTYDQLMMVKAWIFGPDRWAYQVHPPAESHVNLRQVLHLFGPTDGSNVLPEFAGTLIDGSKTL